MNFTSNDLFRSNREILRTDHNSLFFGHEEETYKAKERERRYRRQLRKEGTGLGHEMIYPVDENVLSSQAIEMLVNSTFTVFIARNCSYLIETYFNGNEDAIVCKSANTTTFTETDPLMFVERKYLEKDTKTGPSQYEILPSRIFSIDF